MRKPIITGKKGKTHHYLREFSKQREQVAITELEQNVEMGESVSGPEVRTLKENKRTMLVFLNNRKQFPSFKKLTGNLLKGLVTARSQVSALDDHLGEKYHKQSKAQKKSGGDHEQTSPLK